MSVLYCQHIALKIIIIITIRNNKVKSAEFVKSGISIGIYSLYSVKINRANSKILILPKSIFQHTFSAHNIAYKLNIISNKAKFENILQKIFKFLDSLFLRKTVDYVRHINQIYNLYTENTYVISESGFLQD